MDILIISGLSGAGKSRVAAVLEDMDFYCIDNMPVELMSKFSELIQGTRERYERVALVTDVRTLTSPDELFSALDVLRSFGLGFKILFVEADVPTIVKRYKESRRRHPLDPDGLGLENAVRREIAMLTPVRALADEIIDTSNLTLGNLQTRMVGIFAETRATKPISVNVKSFGFKYGLPIEADMVFDARFLPNPYYVAELSEKTGEDAPVFDFVINGEQTQVFFKMLCDMLDYLLPLFIEEGKRYLVVCIGCTGGRHRSVAIARALSAYLEEQGYPSDCVHRDIGK